MTSIAIRESHNTNQIIISDITIHQDSHGRYSLNDLHTASGGEQKNKPVHWLDTQQTNDLIEEISKVGFSTFEPVFIKKGRYGGTYVCKELVYSYAMWISAAFALKVIRAYDALVTGQIEVKPRKQPKQIAGRITPDQQEAIKQLVLNRGKALPKESQAKAMITMWSALKTHFGCTYKEIESEQFTEALSLAARVPLEGELLSKEELPAPKIQSQLSDDELITLCWSWHYLMMCRAAMDDIYPLLDVAEHKRAKDFHTMPRESAFNAGMMQSILQRLTNHLTPNIFDNTRILNNLRQESLTK
ncbi:KilA-N domain-containing protein [Xenorhabdus sp. KK7.4]|uniref:KilA-N domain-containing protein n=1 Tax=Xenorhabdus sp. KK7.4 TaxID=1851572 RepID=UPI000C062EEA|nr:KilA-N domain-containing protein [Xenorhabdus sp. KK7.4]PHM57023.1 antirepressor [Xenorhabdus sp. KK7.4]